MYGLVSLQSLLAPQIRRPIGPAYTIGGMVYPPYHRASGNYARGIGQTVSWLWVWGIY